jgi:hypothetical protein
LGIIATTDDIFLTLITLIDLVGVHHQNVDLDFLKISGCGEEYSETNANVSIFSDPDSPSDVIGNWKKKWTSAKTGCPSGLIIWNCIC